MNQHVEKWVKEMAELTKPDNIVWINGSLEEKEDLTKQCLKSELAPNWMELYELDQQKYPGCYYHRTAVNDVARVEGKTFICTKNKEDAGPTNNWEDPAKMYAKLSGLFDGCMKGRTMYVIPFIMGPANSPFSKVGVEVSDSIYVVLNMRIMTRMGQIALDELGDSSDFVKGLHSKADLDLDKRYICHFPEDNTIWSVNSGYGGNVLLGKKCFALRIASFQGRKEGWMAEHMLILGIEAPNGDKKYIAAAFPSACGKTNLAMLIPPGTMKGYKVPTVGDDIAWLRIGKDGRLWAVNPENGFFGVVPGTNMKTNPNAMLSVKSDTIYTNVIHTPDNGVWWEGHDDPPPASGTSWKGEPWTPDMEAPGAHPNSRFTAPTANCPSLDEDWEKAGGVPIDAIVFGGRRAKVAPLVYETFGWDHGVFVGATMASEKTAAAEGTVGEIRRDPMAMRPFIGYNVGDYLQHWVDMGKKITNPPKIFNVNWFRLDDNGKFIWPGFGENLRILDWIVRRSENKVDAKKTAIGYIPSVDDINIDGLGLDKAAVEDLLSIDKTSWEQEMASIKKHIEEIDEPKGRLPKELKAELKESEDRIAKL